MCTGAIVIVGVCPEDMAKMGLTQDHDVVQAFSSDEADQPLRMAILPRRSRRNRVIPDAHRWKTLGNGVAIGGVTVAYEIGGRTIPGEGLGDLLCDPLRRRMVGDAQRDQASPLVPQDDQD